MTGVQTCALPISESGSSTTWAERKDIKRETRRLRREIEEVEKLITESEEFLENTTTNMNQISHGEANASGEFSEEDNKKLNDLSRAFDQENAVLEEYLEKWATLQEELEQYPEID